MTDSSTTDIRVPINVPILGQAEQSAVIRVLDSGMLTSSERGGGSEVRRFEGMVRDFTGAKHAVAVNSGTAALQAALISLGVGSGDDVVIPSFTHVSTANAVVSVGARPVFADAGPEFVVTKQTVLEAMTLRTKCVIPVHLYGHMADAERIRDAAGVPVIEDAAQALGSKIGGKMAGTACDAGIYSFYPGKVVTCGEGGVIVTNDREIYESILDARNHGSGDSFGLNLRMPETAAAIGAVQMDRLSGFLESRRRNAGMLSDSLRGKVLTPAETSDEYRNWNLYTISSTRRDKILARLRSAGIGAAVYYNPPVHSLPRFAGAHLPVTESQSKKVLSLPVHPAVTESDLNEMSDIITST